jgi:hypothetical protein
MLKLDEGGWFFVFLGSFGFVNGVAKLVILVGFFEEFTSFT